MTGDSRATQQEFPDRWRVRIDAPARVTQWLHTARKFNRPVSPRVAPWRTPARRRGARRRGAPYWGSPRLGGPTQGPRATVRSRCWVVRRNLSTAYGASSALIGTPKNPGQLGWRLSVMM
jgi:hypothetical protein